MPGNSLETPDRMAGKISSLLDPTRIALDVKSTQRTAALNEISKLLATHPAVTRAAAAVATSARAAASAPLL